MSENTGDITTGIDMTADIDMSMDADTTDSTELTTVIGVKFRGSGREYYFDPGKFTEIKEGDSVIVETSRGTEFCDVTKGVSQIPSAQVIQPLKPVLRIASDYDREQRDKNLAKEKDAYDICMQKITEHKLDMKLVSVEYSFNGSKVVFYFTADGRVDFRELVKDLAGVFKTRIELRQIGVRDEAKMLGGLGSCGRPVCCKQFLPDFSPVSIKMAKEQNLSLSPTKISGICGRLMCCLNYEQCSYESMRKQMPRTGKDVKTPDGCTGSVLENNVITERTKVKVILPDGTYDIKDYPFRDLTVLSGPPQQQQPKPARKEPPKGDAAKPEASKPEQARPAKPAAPVRAKTIAKDTPDSPAQE